MHEPDQIVRQTTEHAGVVIGQSTRTELRNALGEPWLHSERWGFDLHRVDDFETEAGLFFFLYVPVFGGVVRDDQTAYALTTWDQDQRVEAFSMRMVSARGRFDVPSSEHELLLRAGALTLATAQPGSDQLVLWASPRQLVPYLQMRAAAGACTVVIACQRGQPCPDGLRVDDGPEFSPEFVTVMCDDESTCADADKTGLDLYLPSGQRAPLVLFPLAYPLDLVPGTHVLHLGSRRFDQAWQIGFDCEAGEVRYARIEAAVVGQSFWRRGTMQVQVHWTDALPADWPGFGMVLWRAGQWLVEQ